MGLIGNYTLLSKTPVKFTGGALLADSRGNFNQAAMNRARSFSLSSIPQISGSPGGYLAPVSWALPVKPGAIIAFADARSSSTANLAAGRNMEATATSSLTGSADMSQIFNLTASGSASSSSSANLGGIVNATASAAGSLSGSASMGAIIEGDASGSSVSSGSATMTALASMIAAGGGPTPLSPEGLAQAVWDALSSDNASPGSMGELLNGAGGGSSPGAVAEAVWDYLKANANQSGSMGEALKQAKNSADVAAALNS